MSGKSVTIYTDGACTGNPGPGGYCAILEYGEHRRELSGGFRLTTNNRMELMAVIKALEALKEPCQVTVVSDSAYVVNGITKGWAKGWRAKSVAPPGENGPELGSVEPAARALRISSREVRVGPRSRRSRRKRTL